MIGGFRGGWGGGWWEEEGGVHFEGVDGLGNVVSGLGGVGEVMGTCAREGDLVVRLDAGVDGELWVREGLLSSTSFGV